MSEEEVSRFERRAAARTEWERIIDVHEASGQIAAVESRFGTNLVSRFDYASDRLGRMTSAVSAVSTNLFTYDGLDLVSETWNGAAISRATDALGRPASLSFGAPGHFSVSYAYDAFGRFAAVTSSVSSVTSVANYSRLPGSDLLEATSFTIGGSAFDVRRSYEPARSLVTSVSNA